MSSAFTRLLRLEAEKKKAAREVPLPLQLEALRSELAKAQTQINEIAGKIEKIEKQIEVSSGGVNELNA